MTERIKADGKISNLPCNSAKAVKLNFSEVWSLGSFQINYSSVCRQWVDWAAGLQRGAGGSSNCFWQNRLRTYNGVGSEGCSDCVVSFLMTLATIWPFGLVLSILNDTSIIKIALTALKWQHKSGRGFSLTLNTFSFTYKCGKRLFN